MTDLDSVQARNRKAIWVLKKKDIRRLEYEEGGNKILLNDELYILSLTDDLQGDLVNKLDKSGLLEPGNFLIQSPYDPSEYEVLDKASFNFVLAKYHLFTTLCGYLGAREVSIEQIEIKNSKGETKFQGSIETLPATGNLEGSQITYEDIRNNILLHSTFPGSSPDVEAAEAHLAQHRLLSDMSMKSLISQRKGNNPIKSRTLTLNLSQESVSTLRVAAGIKIPPINIPTCVNLNAQLTRAKEESYNFTLTMKVDF